MRPAGPSVRNCTICSGCETGKERNSTESMRLKIAVFAPMPSASVSTAIAVKPGRFNKPLIPWLMSLKTVSII